MKVMGIRNPYEQAMKPTASAGKYDAKASNVKGVSFIDSLHKPLSERKLNPSSLSPMQIFEKENYREDSQLNSTRTRFVLRASSFHTQFTQRRNALPPAPPPSWAFCETLVTMSN